MLSLLTPFFMYRFLFTILASTLTLATVSAADVCIQVIQPATNNTTGVCKEFPTPCDVPSGWTSVESCAAVSVPPKKLIIDGVDLTSCKSYYDGCNNCTVGPNGTACTLRACLRQDTPKCLDEDTSLIEKEKELASTVEAPKFSVKTFNSCAQFNDTLSDILSRVRSPYYYGGINPILLREDAVMSDAAVKSAVAPSANGGSEPSVSTTNTRLGSVDESEIVKTDGKHTYYYDELSRTIRIVATANPTSLASVGSIKIPESWYGVEMYLASNKLAIVATRSVNVSQYSVYWYNPAQKSVLAVYDVTTPSSPKLERYTQIEGSLTTTRRIGDQLYVLTSNNFSLPQRYFPYAEVAASASDIKAKLNIGRVIPRIADGSVNSKGKLITTTRSVANCTSLTAVLPDLKGLENSSLSPTLTTIAIFDLKNSAKEPLTSVVFGDVNETFLTEKSLYLASSIQLAERGGISVENATVTSDDSVSSRKIATSIIAPEYFGGKTFTLIHRFDVTTTGLKYKASATTDGSPLNHYAMDEDAAGNFRIVTRGDWSKNGTNLTIFSPAMKALGKLHNIAIGENFQSARFIGDRLYLVTFESIDPLFVIDVKTPSRPVMIGQMKMPGYSTYLHPYDANHLIGLGYDVQGNAQGGLRNGGIQVALYNIDTTKKETPESLCGNLKNFPERQGECLKSHDPSRIRVSIVGQVNLGDYASNSDATYNPKLFVYDMARKLAFLPATLYTSAGDKNNPYRHAGVFQ